MFGHIVKSNWLVAVIIFLSIFIIYSYSASNETYYNYYTRLAHSFLAGRLYLLDYPNWLNELIPIQGKYFVVYPPMPAILLIPWVVLLGVYSQTLFSVLLGSMVVGLSYLLFIKVTNNKKAGVLMAILFGLGTNFWFLSAVGSAWYLAHVVGVFFQLVSLIEVFGKKRLWIISLCLGAAFWSRTPILFTLPFYLFFLQDKFWPIGKRNRLNYVELFSGIGIFVWLDIIYNFARFGLISPLSPYQLMPYETLGPDFRNGFMSISFISRHLEAAFLHLPKFQNTWPYLAPSLYSLAVWFTTPALLLIYKQKRNNLTLAVWSGVLPTMFIISCWAGVGTSQFGYRFAQDYLLLLLVLIAQIIGNKPSKLAYTLIILSVLVNLWGVLLINKLGIYTI